MTVEPTDASATDASATDAPTTASPTDAPTTASPVTDAPVAPTVAMPPVAGRQGNYAGAVTRLVAFAADIGALWGIFTVTVAAITFAVQLVTGQKVDLSHGQFVSIVTLLALLVWSFVYFAYQWSLSGKTIGMALSGIRVVATDGQPVTGRQAAIRTVTLPLSFLVFGLGFLGILLNKDRHAWHDRMAHTVVVYSWDARAARLRWLAKQDPTPST